jgi:polysaccharide biosynthesis protein PslH
MNILWLLDIDASYGPRHGGTLRYTRFSRGLLARGHRIYYLLPRGAGQDQDKRAKFIEELRSQGCFTDFIEIDESPVPPMARRLSRLAILPHAQRRLLAPYRVESENKVAQLLKELAIDVSIVSDRASFFLLPQLSRLSTAIVDWCDSAVLFEIREIRILAKMKKLAEFPTRLKELIYALTDEAYYGRRSALNVVVAPADKKVLDRLTGKPSVNRTLQNGVEQDTGDGTVIEKDSSRLIFTGSMDFSPNFDGAIWFIERVMPLLLKKRPDVRLVVAGQLPIPRLLESASKNVAVLGFVPDLRAEIQRSQLYVAPLISGTGFRNKLIEAIASGTYVIGTPMALECLDDELRNTLVVARTPVEFAERIDAYLKNPRAFDDRLRKAMRIVHEKYQWNEKVMELENLCHQAMRMQPNRRDQISSDPSYELHRN